MAHNVDDMRPTSYEKAHVDAYAVAQEYVQQAIVQLDHLSYELTTGRLTLTPAEAATMQVHLEAVVVQVAALGVRIRNHLASDASWHS